MELSSRARARFQLEISDDSDDDPPFLTCPVIFDDVLISTSISGILSPDPEVHLDSLKALIPFLRGYPHYVMGYLTPDHYSAIFESVKSDCDARPLALLFFQKFSSNPLPVFSSPDFVGVFCDLLPRLDDEDSAQFCLNILGNYAAFSPEFLAFAMHAKIFDALREHITTDLRTVEIKNWVLSQLLVHANPDFEIEILSELAARMDTGLLTADAYALSGFVNALRWSSAAPALASAVFPRAFSLLASGRCKPTLTALAFFEAVVRQNVVDLDCIVPSVVALLDGP
jgi:hypothetical protein